MIWGSSFLFIKVGVSALPPTYVALGRVLSGRSCSWSSWRSRQAISPGIGLSGAHNAVVGVIGIAVPFTLFSYGETQDLFGPGRDLERDHAPDRAADGGGGLPYGDAEHAAGGRSDAGADRGVDHPWDLARVGGASLSGQLMCLGAAACYGVAIPYTKKFIAPRPESGVVMSVCQLWWRGGVVVAAPILSGGLPSPAAFSWPVVGSVVALGALGTGLAFVINMRNIRLVGASTASMVTYVVPVFATLLGVAVLQERLEWFQPVGAAVVLLGVAVSQGLVSRRRSRPPVASSAADRPLPLCSGESGGGRT